MGAAAAASKFVSSNVVVRMSCANVFSTVKYSAIGSENPEKVIVFGAHIDSWDKGEGAHDDGAGVVQSIEVLHLLKLIASKQPIFPKKPQPAVILFG
jgi:Zn-dependent M28 family amino/carboxypeptidase